MRTLDFNSLDAVSGASSVNGNPANTGYMKSISVNVIATGTLVGSIKLQQSNDKLGIIGSTSPTNWVDIASKTVAVTAAGVFTIPTFDISAGFVRAVYTATSGTGNITAQIHAIGD